MNVTITDWKVEDHLKTEAARAAYIRAAAEEGTPDALPDAFADVFRSMGRTAEAALCESLAAYLRGTAATARRPHKTGGKAAATRKAAKSRALAKA